MSMQCYFVTCYIEQKLATSYTFVCFVLPIENSVYHWWLGLEVDIHADSFLKKKMYAARQIKSYQFIWNHHFEK